MFRAGTLAIALGLASLATTAPAQDFTAQEVEDSFDNVAFAVENAILARGLVIDSVSHVGDMLERTKADVGATRTLFDGAQVFLFCSAAVSRQVMEADPHNIRHCPYGIHDYTLPEAPGRVVVSHRTYDGTMAPVQELLSGIVDDALDLN
jgi:hypothetical protein